MSVPWGHHVEILKKIMDPRARLYYLRASAQFGWSRNVLLNQIKAGAYERSWKAHNFIAALPEHLAEQAEEAMKSSYNLEFLGIGRAVKERELEDRLIGRVQQFILEMGYGFCFIGRHERSGQIGVPLRLGRERPESSSTSAAMPSGIPSPPTRWRPDTTSGQSRNSRGTKTSVRPSLRRNGGQGFTRTY